MSGYGDIRDVLAGLPFPPDVGTGYAYSDIFVVRHEIIRGLDPAPRSVFEFGALRGFFLVTAIDAAPSITHVGWVDDETHTPGSNGMCELNLGSWLTAPATERSYLYWRTRGDVTHGHRYDLVQVDSGHTYDDTLADLHAAAKLDPRWVFLDDWTRGDAHRGDPARRPRMGHRRSRSGRLLETRRVRHGERARGVHEAHVRPRSRLDPRLDPVRLARIRALLRGGRRLAAQRAMLRALTRR